MINWLDYLLILLMILGIVIGYTQGMLRGVLNLASMYLGTILAAQYFHVLGKFFIAQLVTTPGALLNAFAFFIILIAVMAILSFLTAEAYKNTKLTLFPLLDRVGGMVLGLVAMWILASLVINILSSAASTQYWASAEDLRQLLRSGILGSIISAAAEATSPRILDAIRPWVPYGLPAIFST